MKVAKYAVHGAVAHVALFSSCSILGKSCLVFPPTSSRSAVLSFSKLHRDTPRLIKKQKKPLYALPPINSVISRARRKHGLCPRRFSVPNSDVDTSARSEDAGKDKLSGDQDGLQVSSPTDDMQWRIRPPKDAPILQKLQVKIAARIIRAECFFKGIEPPKLLCPVGGSALIETYVRKGKNTGKRRLRSKWKKVARFGITTSRGPSSAEIDDAIRDVYSIDPSKYLGGVGVGAIIYMFVEPEYRGTGIGKLALEVIAAIHALNGCSFTILVANDDGSGKLVKWYETNGFTCVPQLQEVMGSGGGKYGSPMIGPAFSNADFFDRFQIRWW